MTTHTQDRHSLRIPRIYIILATMEGLVLALSIAASHWVYSEPIRKIVCGRLLFQTSREGVALPIFRPHSIPAGTSIPPSPITSVLPPPADTALTGHINPGFLAQVAPGCTHGAIVRVIPADQFETQHVIRAPDGSVIAFSLIPTGDSPPTVYIYKNGKAVSEVTTTIPPTAKKR